MRYYLTTITYNKIARAEDRPQPKGFDTFDEAKKAFHLYMTQAINGATVGWALAIIFNELGNTELLERWSEPAPIVASEPEEDVEPEESSSLFDGV